MKSPRVCNHGFSKTHLYKLWMYMKCRCNNPNRKTKEAYIDRGISVCERWDTSFLNFKEDMGDSYEAHLSMYGKRHTTLDRI